jgi:hypothetical protein
MARHTLGKIASTFLVLSTLGACGALGSLGSEPIARPDGYTDPNNPSNIETDSSNTIWSIFNRTSAEQNIEVNRYLWAATLEVLNFLPIQSVDPFTGVIVTGYGTPPGGGRSYRATAFIDDPALDARSLNLALQTRGGSTVAKATTRAVEDAILTRARELRIADDKF